MASKTWTLGPGSARTALWPASPIAGAKWVPTQAEYTTLMALPYVDEVSVEGSQNFKVVISAPSIERLVAMLPSVRNTIQLIVNRYHPNFV